MSTIILKINKGPSPSKDIPEINKIWSSKQTHRAEENSFRNYVTDQLTHNPMNTSSGHSPRKKRKSKKKIKIVYPLFLKCADLTKDPFWASIFLEAAKGSLPRGFSIQNGILQHMKKNKKQTMDIPFNPLEAQSMCKDFFKTQGNLRSQQDYGHELEIRRQRLTTTNIKIWSDIKKSSTKKLLLESYVNSVSNTLGLNKIQRDKLITCINCGFLSKRLNPVDVILEQGIVVQINGIYQEGNEFVLDPGRKGTRKDLKHIMPESIYLDPGRTLDKIYLSKVNLQKDWEKKAGSINNTKTLSRYLRPTNIESTDITLSVQQGNNWMVSAEKINTGRTSLINDTEVYWNPETHDYLHTTEEQTSSIVI